MKKFLSCSLIVLASCCWVYAQKRVIDEAAYNEWMRKAVEFLQKESFKTKTVVDSCNIDNCIWKPMEMSFAEHEVPGKVRRYGTVVSPRGAEPLPERRSIDNKVYVKRAGSGWQIEERKRPATPDSSLYDAKIECKDLGTEHEGLDELKVLSRTAYVRLKLNDLVNESVQTIKTWIDRSGRFKKQEYLWTDSRRVSRRTISYEVDPSIKVEIPIK